jgi:hypothetical protein
VGNSRNGDRANLPQFHFLDAKDRVRCDPVQTLPTSADYRHNGEDVVARGEMITHHLRQHGRWYGGRCWSSSNCSPLGEGLTILDRIPKKVPWRLNPRKGQEGHGLQIYVQVAVRKVLAGLVVWMTLSTAFIAYWLKQHSGDLQDAVVPSTVSLALFMFYVNLILGLRTQRFSAGL